MLDPLKGETKAAPEEGSRKRNGKWFAYFAILFLTALHVLAPHGTGEQAKGEAHGAVVGGAVLMAIALAWNELLPRLKKWWPTPRE